MGRHRAGRPAHEPKALAHGHGLAQLTDTHALHPRALVSDLDAAGRHGSMQPACLFQFLARLRHQGSLYGLGGARRRDEDTIVGGHHDLPTGGQPVPSGGQHAE